MQEIIFQFHITVQDYELQHKENFINLCHATHVKPLIICLDKGKYIHQPMFTKLIKANNIHIANKAIDKIIKTFELNNFIVTRKKIEIESIYSSNFNDFLITSFKPYFEWHCKIKIIDIDKIKKLCTNYNTHLSNNALEAKNERFITLRTFKSEAIFKKNVKKFHKILLEKNIQILKQKFEYCVYDSQIELDSGWAL